MTGRPGESAPTLRGGRPEADTAVLILHGGQEQSRSPTSPLQPSYIRMLDLFCGLKRASHRSAIYLMRYRVRGWNAGDGTPDPVVDARWALREINRRHPAAPVAILGHSMGGRTAFAVADDVNVVGICALAPWLPEHEPLPPLRQGRRFVLAHGSSDRMTSAPLSQRYAQRLRETGQSVARFELSGARHALLDRPWLWHAFAVGTTLGLVGDEPLPRRVADALADPVSDLTISLPGYNQGPP
jgi:predicted alpha/beta-hydrolase family hydrolase